MKVLGLSPLDKDSTVTIVEDGVITYAAAEERFTRVKLQSGFPWQSLEDALDRTGTKASEIDKVVYPFLPYDELPAPLVMSEAVPLLTRLFTWSRLNVTLFALSPVPSMVW